VRNAFLALLVVNVIFLLWTGLVDRPREAVAATLPPDVPALELAQLPPTPPAPSTHCRSIGPFADASAASGMLDVLHTHALQPRERNVESEITDGYWVYVEDLKDAAARRRMIGALNAAGIHDAAAMPDTSERVSVGVFSDQRHAVHRAEQVQELGFKPTLSVHQRNIATLWLDVDLKASEADPIPVQPPAAPQGPSPSSKKDAAPEAVRVSDCPAKASVGG
jgi:hypothetical protein